MASAQGRVRTPLTGDGILQLRADASGALVVPAVHVPIQGAQPPDHNLFLAGIASVRENGFMLVIPVAELVHQAVVDLEPEDGTEGGPMFYGGKIALLNSRGKAVGECDAELVDLPWGFAACLFPAVQFRGAQAQQFKVLGFVTEAGSAGKPSAESVAALAAQWVEEMDPQTAQEYLSAEEGQPLDLTDPDIISQLQARIVELESEVKRSQTTVPLLPGRSAGTPSQVPKAAGLFQGGPTNLSTADWNKLKTPAGSPPPRVASAEQRRPPLPPAIQSQESLYVDLEREAVEEDFGQQVDPLKLLAQDPNADPVQSMLLASLQQNQILLQKLVGNRTNDPVLKALGGGGSDSASAASSSGVRGCLARDVFIRAVQDLPTVATVVRASAIRELGLSPGKEDSNLLRKYMERRIPLADHKMLSHFATLVAEGWSIAHQSNNVELMGTMGRMMIYIEQTALDSGRTQLSWLLTGLQDPPYHLLVNHRRRPGMEPFSRLCAPSWISANLAYVKDLDYIEARMQNMGKPSKAAIQADEEVQPRAKPKSRPKGKGKGKSNQTGQTQDANDAAE